jgi:putative lumazine-binding protein
MTLQEAWRAPTTPAPTEADRAAIEAVVHDYYEGWYTADAERMARALHPALAKRSFAQGPDHAPELDETTAEEMIEATAAGIGRARAGDRLDIRIAELGAGIASVNVFADQYVDLLHLIETPDGWRIINALWRWADGHGPRA